MPGRAAYLLDRSCYHVFYVRAFLRGLRLRVSDMDDGGMGSLLFESAKPDRSYGRTLSEGCYNDEDGFPVLVAINLDTENEIFELDSWKVDFSPRGRMPESAAEIVFDPTELQQSGYPGPEHINVRQDDS
nr:hypothetical protein [Paenarthrobacter ureafaciens]